MASIGRRLTINDASIEIDTDLPLEELQERFASYVVDNKFLYGMTREGFLSMMENDHILADKEYISFSNGSDDLIYGVLFQAFLAQEGIKITEMEY